MSRGHSQGISGSCHARAAISHDYELDLWPPLASYSVAVKNDNCEAVARKLLHTRGMHIRSDCMVAMIV